ncbi:MAG: ATP-binding cassette domain-containing protein [Actinomycetia bacterium]|nr:ATP-binding cassette domain-containing protein [Actinomycetes bacterium]
MTTGFAAAGLGHRYGIRWVLRALSGHAPPGTAWVLLGESGAGKSTAAAALAGRLRPTAGTATFDAAPVDRRRVGWVRQDPGAVLDPRWPVGRSLLEAARGHRRTALAALDRVRLDADTVWTRRPDTLSGGQRQRAGLAWALAAGPAGLVLDEPTSALDAPLRQAVAATLKDLKASGMPLVIATHDAALARAVGDTVTLLYGGWPVEAGPAARVFAAPHHPYTAAWLLAVPRPDRPPRPVWLRPALPAPQGCALVRRCPFARPRCRADPPPWRTVGPGHYVRCHFA